MKAWFLSFIIPNLVPGRYHFEFDVFVMNEYGTHFSYDHPIQKIYFEVVDDETVESIRWQRNYFGNVRLNELKVLTMQENN